VASVTIEKKKKSLSLSGGSKSSNLMHPMTRRTAACQERTATIQKRRGAGGSWRGNAPIKEKVKIDWGGRRSLKKNRSGKSVVPGASKMSGGE